MITKLDQFKINERSSTDFIINYSSELKQMMIQLTSIHNSIEPFLIEDDNNISPEQQQLFDGIDNILSKYDKYLERIIFDTQTTKLSELVDSALQNEERIGTEPQFMIFAIEEVYNFLKTKNIINENIDDELHMDYGNELYMDDDNYPYDFVLTDGRYLWISEQDFDDMAGETNYYTTYFVGNTDDIRSSSQVKFKDIENLLSPEDRASLDAHNKEQGDSNYANSKSFVESKTNEDLTTKSYLNKKGEVLREVINNIPNMSKPELRKIATNKAFYGAGVAKLAQDQLHRLAKEESKTNENIKNQDKINESIDSKYLSIIIKNIKSELDAIQHFYDTNKIDLVKEYLKDQIKTINDIIKKL